MANKSNKVNGGDMLLLGKRVGDTVFKPVLCQTTLQLGRQLNTTDDSSKCGKDVTPTTEDGTVTMEGYLIKGSPTDVLSAKDVEDLFKTEDVADYVIGTVTPDVNKLNNVTYRFSGTITQTNVTANNNEKVKVSITITTTTPVDTGVLLPTGGILWDKDVAGYTVDLNAFFGAVNNSLPLSYQSESSLLFAPGITKLNRIAGVNAQGGLVEFLFFRSGTAGYFDKTGTYQIAAANMPRIDYVNGAGALVERATTNMCLNSEKLSAWSKTNSTTGTVTDNGNIVLNGLNLCRITMAGTGIYQIINVTGIVTVTHSIFVSSKNAVVRVSSDVGVAATISARFDFNTHTIIMDSNPPVSAVMKKISGDLYRCSITYNTIASSTATTFIYDVISGTVDAAGCAQTELNINTPSSYIATTTATVTRVADSVRTIDNQSYAASTILLDSTSMMSDSGLYISQIGGATLGILYPNSTNGEIRGYDGVNLSSLKINVDGLRSKIISKFGSGTKNIVVNGTLGISSAYNDAYATPGIIQIGGSTNMKITCIAIIPRKVSDAEAQTITTLN